MRRVRRFSVSGGVKKTRKRGVCAQGCKPEHIAARVRVCRAAVIAHPAVQKGLCMLLSQELTNPTGGAMQGGRDLRWCKFDEIDAEFELSEETLDG